MSRRSLAIAAGLVAGLAIPTIAHAAYTKGWVNVRSGPGTGYRIVTTAPPGAFVAVGQCVPRWCRINFRGVNGWMSSAYIAPGPYYAPQPYYRPPPPPPIYYPPYYARRYPHPYPYPYRYPGPYQPRSNFGFYFGFGH